MRRFEGLSVGLAEPEVVLFLIESRKHRSSMTGSESSESPTPTTVLYVLQLEMGGLMQRKKVGSFGIIPPPPKQEQSIEVMTLHGLQKRIGTLKVFPQQDPQNFQSRYTVTVTR